MPGMMTVMGKGDCDFKWNGVLLQRWKNDSIHLPNPPTRLRLMNGCAMQ